VSDARPDPDKLLERVQRAEEKARAGRLKVFFGACAGVGKTYAMLSEAHEVKDQGSDVVVGIVETHGRRDTEALLADLEVLPPRNVEYRDTTLRELDVDGVLARKPGLVLVDELAHSNAPGSRHPKRWQDVKEILGAGIDVYCTVNVQHLESLNDVVGQITGIRVAETVPDTVFDEAHEIAARRSADWTTVAAPQGRQGLHCRKRSAAAPTLPQRQSDCAEELALRRTADGDAQA
jgi:two-component system sensor histidine kinase KdpD